jgi:hypothetical protein
VILRFTALLSLNATHSATVKIISVISFIGFIGFNSSRFSIVSFFLCLAFVMCNFIKIDISSSSSG